MSPHQIAKSSHRRSPVARGILAAVVAMTVVVTSAGAALAAPTAAEQQLIYEINRARWNPTEYGLPSSVQQRPPLAVNNQLAASARTTANCTPSGDAHYCNGTYPNGRVRNAGYPLPWWWQSNANFVESTYGGGPAAGPLDVLTAWANSSIHLDHVFAQTASYASHREIGTGHNGGRWILHTAHRETEAQRLFVTGVAFADAGGTGSGRMNQGEGRSDVTIELRNGSTVVASTTTNAGGGYSLLVPTPGTYTVRAHGNGFNNLTAAVVPVNHNVGLDFLTNGTFQLRQMDFTPGPEVSLIAMVDPTQGRWYFGDSSGTITSFFFGNPGDVPIMGDWDCDGERTPGMFRQSNGLVYLRNSNSSGNADVTFYFGNPGDIPIVGDFDNDCFETVSIYRPSNQTFYIMNELGQNGGGLGAADFAYVFGNPGDKPFAGDFNDDGVDTIGLHRESTGLVYYRNSHTQGNADNQFLFGNPGDRFYAGDWNNNNQDSPGLFRPGSATHYFRYTNTQGNADSAFVWGAPTWLPLYYGG